MSSKPFSPSEEPNSRILRGYCRAKEFDDPGPLYTRPRACVEEGKMPKDVQRKRKWPRDVAEDDPALGIPNPKRREQYTGKGSLPGRPQKKDKYSRISISVWCRSNPKRNCHIRIKCTQLTFWPH